MTTTDKIIRARRQLERIRRAGRLRQRTRDTRGESKAKRDGQVLAAAHRTMPVYANTDTLHRIFAALSERHGRQGDRHIFESEFLRGTLK